MSLLVTGKEIVDLKDSFVLCDNDFISTLANDQQIFLDTLEFFPNKKLALDQFVEMEFLRSVFEPKQRQIKEDFVNRTFIRLEKNQHVLTNIMDKAMELSRLYAHVDQGKGASLVDLLLAGRLATSGTKLYLITGNAKDFPSCIFDLVSVVNFEQKDGTVRAISIKSFNKQKYEEANLKYQKMVDRNRG